MSTAASSGSRERLAGSDLLRAVATVGVICIHASYWGPRSPWAAVGFTARFSVPVFAVLTGVLLGYQYRDRPLGRDFAARRLSRSVVPWLIWAPLYLLFGFTVTHEYHPVGSSVTGFFSYGAGHLWFLLLVPQLYAVFLLWPRRRAWLAAAVALCVQTALALLRVYGPLPANGLGTLVLWFGPQLVPFWIGYFAVGLAAGRAWRPLPASLRRATLMLGPVAIAATGYLLLNERFAGARYASFVQGTGAFLDPVLPLFVFSIMAWLLAVAPLLMRSARVAAPVRLLSDLSLGVYIVHPMALWYLGKTIYTWFLGPRPVPELTYSALVLGALLISMVVVRLVAATPLAFTVGMRRRPLEGNVAVLALRARDALLLRHPQRVDQR